MTSMFILRSQDSFAARIFSLSGRTKQIYLTTTIFPRGSPLKPFTSPWKIFAPHKLLAQNKRNVYDRFCHSEKIPGRKPEQICLQIKLDIYLCIIKHTIQLFFHESEKEPYRNKLNMQKASFRWGENL